MPEIKVGDVYEDCAYHPVLCTRVNPDDDELTGISLIDASTRNCSSNFCGVIPLTIEQVLEARRDFQGYKSRRIQEDKLLALEERTRSDRLHVPMRNNASRDRPDLAHRRPAVDPEDGGNGDYDEPDADEQDDLTE